MLAVLSWTGVAYAQSGGADFPSKAVRFIVPFPPGGPADTLVRQIAERLAVKWKQPVLVENRPGGHTTIGTSAVATAVPDGHTIGLVTGSHVINPALLSKLPYDTLNDLTGVMILTRVQIGVFAHASFQAGTPAELIAFAQRDPAQAMYGSATPLTTLGMEVFNAMAGTKMTSVPYKGSAQAVQDLLAGNLKLLVSSPRKAITAFSAPPVPAWKCPAARCAWATRRR